MAERWAHVTKRAGLTSLAIAYGRAWHWTQEAQCAVELATGARRMASVGQSRAPLRRYACRAGERIAAQAQEGAGRRQLAVVVGQIWGTHSTLWLSQLRYTGSNGGGLDYSAPGFARVDARDCICNSPAWQAYR